MASGNFDRSSFDASIGGFDVDPLPQGVSAEPEYDRRIIEDDEEVMKAAVLFITLMED